MRKLILLIVLVTLILGGLGFILFQTKTYRQPVFTSFNGGMERVGKGSPFPPGQVPWEFTGEEWRATQTPPACPQPLQLKSPVDVSFASAVLYPGQYRNNQYKSHGGFAFQNNSNEEITVTAPIDAYLVKASRYIEMGEVQYYLVFIHPCGIMYKLDHLAELSPQLNEVMKQLPEPQVDDSRTTPVEPPILVQAGEVIATSVGFSGKQGYRNVTFDFGVMDLRRFNQSAKNAEWLAKRKTEGDREFAPYAVCWFDLFDAQTAQTVRSLPAYNQTSGNQSDYCQ